MEPGSRTRLLTLLRKTMVAFGGLSVLGLFIGSAVVIFGCSVPITYEGIELYASWMLGHGANIYDPARLHVQPWIVNIYPPLMSVFGSVFARDAESLLLGLRAISVVCFIATIAFLFLLVRKMGADRASAFAAVIFFASCVPVWFTSLIAKPDYLCMAFESLAMLVFWHQFSRSTEAKSWYAMPGALCLVALAAKQQGMIAPLTILVFLLLQRQFGSALRFSVVVGLGAGVLIGALQLATGGFIQHLSFLRHVQWGAQNIYANVASLGYDGLKVLVVLAFASFFRPANELRSAYVFVLALIGVCLVESVLIFGVPGATSNHFITPLFAIALMAALASTRFQWLPPVLSVVSVVLVIDLFDFARSQAETVKAGAVDCQNLMPTGGALLSEDPYWVLRKGARPVIVDCTTFTNVWKREPADQAPLVEAIKAKAFTCVMINVDDDKFGGGDVWTKEVVGAIKGAYKPVGAGTGNGRVQQIYLPK